MQQRLYFTTSGDITYGNPSKERAQGRMEGQLLGGAFFEYKSLLQLATIYDLNQEELLPFSNASSRFVAQYLANEQGEFLASLSENIFPRVFDTLTQVVLQKNRQKKSPELLEENIGEELIFPYSSEVAFGRVEGFSKVNTIPERLYPLITSLNPPTEHIKDLVKLLNEKRESYRNQPFDTERSKEGTNICLSTILLRFKFNLPSYRK